jgi:hypothetical protein
VAARQRPLGWLDADTITAVAARRDPAEWSSRTPVRELARRLKGDERGVLILHALRQSAALERIRDATYQPCEQFGVPVREPPRLEVRGKDS